MVPSRTYWPRVVEMCRRHDILIVADEVVCGFGRTGSWFGSQTFGITPDFMTMAKGLSSGHAPIAAVGIQEGIAEFLRERAGEIVHGFTYSGHPMAAAVALRNLQIVEDERLVERVGEDIGPYLQERFRSLLDHPLVGEVRGIGLLAAIEIVKNKDTGETFGDRKAAYVVRGHCFRNGIIVRAARDCLYCSPPLVITREEVDTLVTTLRHCLDAAAEELRVA
jgi:putrescine aminotransferase